MDGPHFEITSNNFFLIVAKSLFGSTMPKFEVDPELRPLGV
jgi:hypothetical protein